MTKMFITLLIFLSFMNQSFAKSAQLNDLAVKEYTTPIRNIASMGQKSNFFSTTNLAWGTMVLLGATALTGREQKVNPLHLSLASLSMISYGAFLNSYFTNDDIANNPKYKWASYSKWLHIPAMLLLPIAGSIAQRHFAKGKTSATGIGSTHKPAALAAVVGMALTTLSLTFDF